MPTESFIPSTSDIFGWVEKVFDHGVRRPGYAADRWAEQWLHEQFTAFGLTDVRHEPVEVPKWEDRASALRVWPADNPDAALDLPCFALPHCTPTNNLDGGLDGELVQFTGSGAGRDNSSDYGVAGKFAVMEFGLIRMPQLVMQQRASRVYDPAGEFKRLTQVLPFSTRFQAVMEPAIDAKASAFIGVLSGLPWDTHDYYVPYDGVERPIPGVWLSAANGKRLQALMDAGPVRGRITVDAVREPIICYNVVGALPGASDEWIIIGSHHDGPWASAVEDGSGVALVLAQAKYWSRIPQDQRPHNLLFLLNAGHMVGGAGCQAFVAAHQELLPSVVCEIHLEHAARECACDDGKLVPTDKPEVRWWFTSLNDALEDIVEGALKAEDLRRSLIVPPELFGPHPTTDGGFFHIAKVPLVNYLTAPMYLFDSQDTLDKIHTGSLVPVTRATIRIIEGLAAHTATELRAGMRNDDTPSLLR